MTIENLTLSLQYQLETWNLQESDGNNTGDEGSQNNQVPNPKETGRINIEVNNSIIKFILKCGSKGEVLKYCSLWSYR